MSLLEGGEAESVMRTLLEKSKETPLAAIVAEQVLITTLYLLDISNHVISLSVRRCLFWKPPLQLQSPSR